MFNANGVAAEDEVAERPAGCACGCDKTEHEQFEDIDLEEFAELVWLQLTRELQIERERRERF